MREDKLIVSDVSQDQVKNAIGIPESLLPRLNDDQITQVIIGNNADRQRERDAGLIGKLVGAHTDNASINVALTICSVCLFLCASDLVASFFVGHAVNLEMWNTILPVVTLALGYIFGKR